MYRVIWYIKIFLTRLQYMYLYLMITVFPVKPWTPEKISGMFIIALRPIRCEMKPQKITDKLQQGSVRTWYETTSWPSLLREIFNFLFVSLWKSFFFTTNQHVTRFISHLIGRETLNIPEIFSGVHSFMGKTVLHWTFCNMNFSRFFYQTHTGNFVFGDW